MEKLGSVGRGDALVLFWGGGTSDQSKDDAETGV